MTMNVFTQAIQMTHALPVRRKVQVNHHLIFAEFAEELARMLRPRRHEARIRSLPVA